MRRAMIFTVVLLVLFGVFAWFVNRARNRVFALPLNSPAACQKKAPPDTRTVALLGDSLTHGTVSENYVDLLERRFRGRPYRFINAGVNSHLAYNLHERVDGIIACRPDVVVVLIGTNDVNALVSEEKLKSYMREQKLPQRPDAAFFRRHLSAVVTRLGAETKARIGVMSLPPIGEDLTSEANRRIIAYSEIVADVVKKNGATYLPLREAFWKTLETKPAGTRKPRDCAAGNYPITAAVVRRYLLGRSWDSISENNGFQVLTDCLHLNSRGAALVADMAAGFINSGER